MIAEQHCMKRVPHAARGCRQDGAVCGSNTLTKGSIWSGRYAQTNPQCPLSHKPSAKSLKLQVHA
eukprot:6461057-Amphidinium_carterae.2